jgi:predicted component of viral defense system (DUF524 family)
MKTTAVITKEPITRPSIDSNILQLLHKDHQKIAELFFQYTNLKSDKDKQECVAEIIKKLTVHAQVEEEIVDPAVRDDVDDSEDIMDEADTEHRQVLCFANIRSFSRFLERQDVIDTPRARSH